MLVRWSALAKKLTKKISASPASEKFEIFSWKLENGEGIYLTGQFSQICCWSIEATNNRNKKQENLN